MAPHSRILTTRPAGTLRNSVTDPEDHSTRTAFASLARPRPKCNVRLEEHPYPDQPATRSHCFPSSVVTSTHAPMPSRFDLEPSNSNAIQLPDASVRFQRTWAGS